MMPKYLKMMPFLILSKPVFCGDRNERLCLPINQNILAAAPYIIVYTVHQVHQPALPLPFPDTNIQHQAQYDPGANISATNNISVLQDTVALESPFPILSAD
jgi:hypothetical protein